MSVKPARRIYDKTPYMWKVFKDKFNQRLIALIADNGYNLCTTIEWNKAADLKGKISILLLTVPIFAPIAVAFGYDPLAFAIIGIISAETGLPTPPFGIL